MIYTIIFNFYFQFHRWYEWEDRDFFHALQEASCQTSRVQCLQNSESSNWRFSSCPANSAGIYEGDQSIIICFFFWIILLIEMRWMQMRWMRWRALESGMDHILWSAVNLVDFKRGTWWVDIGYSWALEVDMCGLIKSGLKHKYQLLLIHINYQVPFQTSCVRCCRILPVFLSFALLLYIHHSYQQSSNAIHVYIKEKEWYECPAVLSVQIFLSFYILIYLSIYLFIFLVANLFVFSFIY